MKLNDARQILNEDVEEVIIDMSGLSDKAKRRMLEAIAVIDVYINSMEGYVPIIEKAKELGYLQLEKGFITYTENRGR